TRWTRPREDEMSKRKKIKLVGMAAGIVLALALVSPAIAGRGSHAAPHKAKHASSDATLSVLHDLKTAENDDVQESPEPSESPDVAESPGAGNDDDHGQVENEQLDNDDQGDVEAGDNAHEVSPSPEPSESPDSGGVSDDGGSSSGS